MTQAKTLEWNELLTQALTLEGSTANTYNRFYNYSMMNRVYLWLQDVSEPVATYKKWQQLGRQVKKGSKAKMIVKPIFYKADEKDEEFTLGGFKPMNCLFTYSETEGEELPPIEIEAWNKELALTTLDITEEDFASTSGNTQGYSHDRALAINPMAKYPVKTLMHELAHIVIGHTESKEDIHRGVMEFQAEATAHIIMHELELTDKFNASESRAYIQNWLQGNKPTDSEIKAVFKAVDTIIKAGRKEQADNEQK